MDTVVMSQVFTQTAQPRRGGGTEKFVDALIKFQARHADGIEGISESSRKAVISNLQMLQSDGKWLALSRLLIQLCAEDRGGRLFEFTHSIFHLLPLLPSTIEAEQLQCRTIKFLTGVLIRTEVSLPNFIGMYSDLMVQLENISVEGLMGIAESVGGDLEEKSENAENSENSVAGSEKKYNQRWKDFVGVVVKKIREIKELTHELEVQTGAEVADKLLFHWLEVTENVDAFELVADIATSTSIDKFCDEVVAENIALPVEDGEVDQEVRDSEMRRRASLTWKSIILTTKVTDKERQNRLWNGVICSWEVGDDVENDKLSIGLDKCLMVGKKVLSANQEAAKKFLGIIRTEKYRILSSELGLALALIQCSLDRNDALAEMKKTLQKLYRTGEQAEECVWMADIVTGRLLRLVDRQLRLLAEVLGCNPVIRKLLGKPIFSLMLSLLDTPAYQKNVVIVDGKVADGCALWLLARDVLIVVSQSQNDMASQLSLLFQSIASASNNSSALILIDVLRELVRKCSVEILNNSKLIDGLFDYVCRMRRDVSVSLIRCLIPIINTRPQLRTSLFKSLKKDLLCESTVTSAVPIVLMLLRSVSKRREDGGGGQFDHSMSQSFGSFSTQTLNSMGLKKNVDQEVGLELIGIVRRCMWQPASTKVALYDGICELATQTTTMLNQFLELIISHANSLPDWSRHEMTVTTDTVVQLVEPLPQLIQTVECLISELSLNDNGVEGTDILLGNATSQMNQWVETAMRSDVADLGLERNLEWGNTQNGRSSLLMCQMMLNTYDVLVEHMWRRLEALEKREDADKLVALLNRRKELEKLFREKTMKKEGKDGSADKVKEKEKEIPIDTSEVLTSAKTLASIMKKLTEDEDTDTTINVRPDIIADVKLELITWAISRSKVLSATIVKEYRPLHSILSGTSSLMCLSRSLLNFYVGANCPQWIIDIETGSPIKTLAIESYAHIIHHLSVKYKQAPARVTAMWVEEKEGEDEEARKKRSEPNIVALRQAHFLSCRLFPQVLSVENEDIEEEKKPKAQYEMQSKAILKSAIYVLSMTKNQKVWSNLSGRLMKVLKEETFCNNQMLRGYCNFVVTCGLRSETGTNSQMSEIMEAILEFLSEEGEELKFQFISKTTMNVAIEFEFVYVEKTLNLLKEAFGFLKDFFVKPPVFDGMLNSLLQKSLEITELISRVLQITVQYKMMQERVTEIMTSYFSTIQMAVILLHNLTKGWGREMSDWESVNALATLVKTKLTPILAMVDDHIGFSKGKEEMKKKISQKTRYAKSKRDEKLFSKFSQEREAVQHAVLVLCKLIKDERFDLQIKNNSMGYRDFRIDMEVIRSKLGAAGAESADNTEEVQEPTPKRRRRQNNRNDTEEPEPEEPEEQEEQDEEMEQEEEKARNEGLSVSRVKQEVDEEEPEEERTTSPVF